MACLCAAFERLPDGRYSGASLRPSESVVPLNGAAAEGAARDQRLLFVVHPIEGSVTPLLVSGSRLWATSGVIHLSGSRLWATGGDIHLSDL